MSDKRGFKPFTKEQAIEFKKMTGYADWKNELKSRQIGKSTGIALETLGYCLRHPGEPVKVWDHHESHRHMYSLLWDLIDKLNLLGFTMNKAKGTIVYELDFSEIDEL